MLDPVELARVSAWFDWELQLAHQTHNLPTAQACLTTVRSAYSAALGWE